MLIHKGFTLIEVAVTLVIFSIIIMMASPYMSDMLQNSKIRSASEQLKGGLQIARSEAIRRNTTMVFTLNSTAWSVDVPNGTAPTKQGVLGGMGAITITPSANTVSFNSVGATTNTTIDLTGTAACKKDGGDISCLRVEVLAGGAIQTCDTNITTTGADHACSL